MKERAVELHSEGHQRVLRAAQAAEAASRRIGWPRVVNLGGEWRAWFRDSADRAEYVRRLQGTVVASAPMDSGPREARVLDAQVAALRRRRDADRSLTPTMLSGEWLVPPIARSGTPRRWR